MLKSNGFLEQFLCLVDFKPTANNVHTIFSTTILSSVVFPVGGGGLGQCDGDSSSSWNMWVNQLQRIGHNQLENKTKQIK